MNLPPPPSAPNPSLSKALPSVTWAPNLSTLPALHTAGFTEKGHRISKEISSSEICLGGFCCAAERAQYRAEPMSQLSFGSATRMCWRHFLHSEKIDWALQNVLSLNVNILFCTHMCAFVHSMDSGAVMVLLVCISLVAFCLKNAEISVRAIHSKNVQSLVLSVRDHFQANINLNLKCSFEEHAVNT